MNIEMKPLRDYDACASFMVCLMDDLGITEYTITKEVLEKFEKDERRIYFGFDRDTPTFKMRLGD